VRYRNFHVNHPQSFMEHHDREFNRRQKASFMSGRSGLKPKIGQVLASKPL
jgi:hypothetical protein